MPYEGHVLELLASVALLVGVGWMFVRIFRDGGAVEGKSREQPLDDFIRENSPLTHDELQSMPNYWRVGYHFALEQIVSDHGREALVREREALRRWCLASMNHEPPPMIK